MNLNYITLAVALLLSTIAAFYSISGLTSIFIGVFYPIVIMGGILEIAKIVTTLWLHKYWSQATRYLRIYLSTALGILMLLTSIGIFGYLSAAHLAQVAPNAEVNAQLSIYDDKIAVHKETLNVNRKIISQLDAELAAVLNRSTDTTGADKAIAVRRSQAGERARIAKENAKAQEEIGKLIVQRAPIATDSRKADAAIGPLKYIATLIYGDNPTESALESAVRFLIILIVIVFDPLALALLLAATLALKWDKPNTKPADIEHGYKDQARKEARTVSPPREFVIPTEMAIGRAPKPRADYLYSAVPETVIRKQKKQRIVMEPSFEITRKNPDNVMDWNVK